jgi:hypothetical protein
MRTEQSLKHAAKRALQLAAILAAVAFAAPAWAQREYTLLPATSSVSSLPAGTSLLPASDNAEMLSTIRIPENIGHKERETIGVERLPSRRNWIILSAVQYGAAAFDAYSTRQAIQSGAVERDPLMRPFAQSPAMYAAIQVGPLLLDYAARKMQRSRYDAVRKLWWVPQSATTLMYIGSGVHNLRVANHP